MKYRYAFVIENDEIVFEADYTDVEESTWKPMDMLYEETDTGYVITVIVEVEDG